MNRSQPKGVTMNAVEETGDGWVRFAIEVRVPLRQASIVAAALTGNDDDVILAAERAMRERIEDTVEQRAEAVERWGSYDDLSDRIELAVVDEKIVTSFLADGLGWRG
jgi:hypothetical protein